MNKLNVTTHMNGIRRVLAYSSNIGFFFGAGTSCAFGLPAIDKLTERVKNTLSPEMLSVFSQIEDTIKDLSKSSKISVENILNYIREIRVLTNERPDYKFTEVSGLQAAEIDKAICLGIYKIINEDSEKADISLLRRFFAWYAAANRTFVKEIYTSNYDMLLEKAMEANRSPYYDGFTGSYEPFFYPESMEAFPGENDFSARWIRLWKIHGSLNWVKKPADKLSEAHIIREGRIPYNHNPQNELMIYPSKEKYNLSRKEPFVAYFDRLKKYLNHGELVFIMSGYSFGDDHINEIILNALRSNNRLFVIVLSYDDEQVKRMEEQISSYTNLCVMGPTKVITNGTLKEWQKDDFEDKDTGDGTYWENENFLLGDFRKLVDFLIENSGRKNTIEDIANAK